MRDKSLTRRAGEAVPPAWSTAGIADAQAFRVGKSRKVHKPARFTPQRVVGVCGVVAYAGSDAAYDGLRLAEWADSFVTCSTCKGRA